jgi:hypothetical protein
MSCVAILHELSWKPGANTDSAAASVSAALDAVTMGVFAVQGGGMYSCDEFESLSEISRLKDSLPLSIGCLTAWPTHAGRALKGGGAMEKHSSFCLLDQYGGGDVVVVMQEPTTVHETIYRTSKTQSETSLAGPCIPPLQSVVPALESPLQKIKIKHQTTPSTQKTKSA